ncbi:hypothetical protein QL285_074398 [Trifolium repens]|nr:hypothetical protein QL285_074398 [Trifolium repens]
MEWSRDDQPVGEAAGLLGGYIGSVGTSFNKFPIDKLRWPDVSSKIKDEVYKDSIQTKFDVNDGIHKHHILGKIGKRWRDNRNSLKPENQEKAAKNAANRAKQTIPHTLGTMTWARFRHRLESDDGCEYTRGDMFSPSHKRSNGSFVNAEAQKKSEELETHRQANSSVSDDAYIAVFGKEHAGHVRGMGHGVVPSKYLGRSSGTPASTSGGIDVTREELDASNAKIRSLEEQIAFLTQQFALHSRGSQNVEQIVASKKQLVPPKI